MVKSVGDRPHTFLWDTRFRVPGGKRCIVVLCVVYLFFDVITYDPDNRRGMRELCSFCVS